jgi:hypothetical protein
MTALCVTAARITSRGGRGRVRRVFFDGHVAEGQILVSRRGWYRATETGRSSALIAMFGAGPPEPGDEMIVIGGPAS